ncbi:molecular chaperone [Campylobacter sp. 19-13652]|uniref:TorD/DmsD family molecular chaperone n=1 Tax=Campylobacter sp. 19-13652 TaxID=2840180 RepID=UPI001C77C88B|nr:molecular chaperone TorD family protein [Campylobacter sp. 19-13652]BCX79979.1 hypothetical protein LBC_14410 [Campylobacter sp. 19-13652]
MFDADTLRARAYYYEFLAFVFFYDEKGSGFLRWKGQLEHLSQSALSVADEAAFNTLKEHDFDKFINEQNSVLFDLSYANIPLNASFYEDGRDDGAARLRVIELLKKSDYRRNLSRCKDSEDFIGFVFLFSSQLLLDASGGASEMISIQEELFKSVINPFIDEFIALLADHSEARFYAGIAQILSSFIALERGLLGVGAPASKARSIAREAMSKKPYQSKMPTPKSKLFWDEFTAL